MAWFRHRRRGALRIRIAALGVVVGLVIAASSAYAQLSYPDASASRSSASPFAAAHPEPIYWRQNLFLIPYQWSAAADPGSTASVWLYVSKDRGGSWQKISEARPQVRAFNYHAEADGEYWFAIRTTDGQGEFWPAGPIQPELCVIVDTSIPRFERLTGVVGDDGLLKIQWQVADANVDPKSWLVEMQTEPAGDWQPVAQPQSQPAPSGVAIGLATMPIAAGGRPLAVRVAATDLAGNRAVSQVDVSRGTAVDDFAGEAWPAIISGRSDDAPQVAPLPDHSQLPHGDGSGWVASRSAVDQAPPNSANAPSAIAPQPTTAIRQPWPADGRAPAAIAHDDSKDRRDGGVSGEFASLGRPAVPRPSPFAPLEPFRQPAAKPWDAASQGADADGALDMSAARSDFDPWLWLSGPDLSLPPGTKPRLVNSRSFVLEYELEDIGPWGVSKVELWGTRDGGRTWRSYATDVDQTSPMQVTVGGGGLYGFRIVVSGGGGVGGFPPQPGERPELWVGVDLHRPEIELTGAEPGSGELAGHMLLRWWADDDNLQERPIGLFYSSRPVGPWTAVATSVTNTGEYPWRLERHLPPRVYLRLEARDTAGNLAAFQTHEPVSIELPPPSGRIEAIESIERSTVQRSTATAY
jgi:hypothetical protein